MTYGAKADYKSGGREPTDYVNSRLIVMWGWSPGDGTFGTGTLQYLKLAKKQGARIVCVDPRVTRTSHALADEHVFIRPSTDAAALIAMAYVIVTEGLHDQAFLDRHVLGFDEAHLPAGAPDGASYRSYLLGLADGVRKTPAWAAAITGMPAETIRRLAIEYATTKPAALQCGYAPGRTANGEQFHRAAYALTAITGSVGTPGGNSGVSNGATGRGGIRSLPPGPNPAGARVATPLLADLLERGRAGGYPADIKMVYSVGGDLFNQTPNTHKTAAAAERLEFMVVHDHFVTPTARYADVVLPATTFWERNDVHTPWAGAGHYVIFMKQAVAPMYECRNDFDICADIARRLGIDDYSDKTEEEWLRESTRWPSRRTRTPTAWGRSRRSRPGFPTRRTAAGIRCGWSPRNRGRARTRSTTTSRSSCAPTATTSGSTPPTPPHAASSTASPCACSTSAAPPASRRVSPTAWRPASCPSRKGPGSRRARTARTRTAAPTC
ncbi:MAG: hypothetical protein DME13_29535 [Candidatus Rokuibacteriota bacterium]|nr:MAG: hypothetical protein DME13_29535 [Candidatus Rokubacteria bacterium]